MISNNDGLQDIYVGNYQLIDNLDVAKPRQ